MAAADELPPEEEGEEEEVEEEEPEYEDIDDVSDTPNEREAAAHLARRHVRPGPLLPCKALDTLDHCSS